MEFENLNAFIEYFESLDFFEWFNFCSKENKIKNLTDDEKDKLWYEYLAFWFMYTRDSEHIFAPFLEFKKNDWSIVWSPDRSQVNILCMDYWYDRLEKCKSDFMKFRYAALLIDFSDQVIWKQEFIGKYWKNSYYIISDQLINAWIIILKDKRITYNVWGRNYIEIMIKFWKLYNQNRLWDVVNSCISFEDDIAEDKSPWLRWFSCRYFILDEDFPTERFLNDRQKNKIIKDLECRMERLKDINDINWVEHCVELLLAYNHKIKNHDKIDELLTLLEKVYEDKTLENLHPMIQETYYDNLKRLYLKYDNKNKEKISVLNIKIKNLGPQILGNLNTFKFSVPVSDEEYTTIINYYYNLEEKRLDRWAFAIGMIPNRKKSEESLKKLANEFPLLYRWNIKQYDKNWVCVSEIIHADSEDLDNSQKILQYQRDISINFSLNEICKLLKENNSNDNILKSWVLLDLTDINILDKLRYLYINWDNLEFCCIAIPLIESTFRKMLEKVWWNILKDTKRWIEYKNLHDLLYDELLIKSIPAEFNDFIYYCRVLFIEKHWFNLRNNLSHWIDLNQFLSDTITNRILHVLYCLSILKFNK